MANTNNSYAKPEEFVVDVGEGDVFLGQDFERPYFFDTIKWKMMEKWKPENIHIKTWKGEIFQFRLYTFHNRPAMLITSTMQDTFTVIPPYMGLKKTLRFARKNSKVNHAVKGSYTGYWTWGHYFEEQYERLDKNMRSQNVFFSDTALNEIYKELLRRRDEKNK